MPLLAPSDIPSITSQTPKVTLEPLSTTSSQWLTLRKATFLDPSNTPRAWEVVERVKQGGDESSVKATVDAVDILATLHSSSAPTGILLVLQFRPPVQSWTLEFPSGLIDPSETLETALARELLEETGFRPSKVLSTGPPIAYEPGMTASCSQMVHVEVRE
ncbi:hypothetical protein HDV00_008927 [Rhizophlyctis rosea]|nr:hypothetical protein HDV00_008927 [Rhizophlyctis rosea]